MADPKNDTAGKANPADTTQRRIDEPTGTEFVGHEWDGIEELDTPMPRWWVICFYITIIWAIGFAIAYPSWPLIERGTQGLLGWTSRGQLADEMQKAEDARLPVREAIGAASLVELTQDEELLAMAVAGGSAAFKVNCVQCHGAGAAGNQTLGYPNLNDDDWLWGGDIQAIRYTLVHGIREPGTAGTRTSLMPAFDGAFDSTQTSDLVDHVLALSGKAQPNPAGAQTYAQNCALCHGPAGQGDRALGAPRLDDAIWLRGSQREEITAQILNPKVGMMPSWEERLDPVTVTMLAAYVHSLGGGEDLVEDIATQEEGTPAEESDDQT